MEPVFDKNSQQIRDTRTGQGDSGVNASEQRVTTMTDPRERPYWAGVTKGRDGLLGRIETTLGSIS